MKGKEYSQSDAAQQAVDLSNRIRDACKDLNIPSYKICVQTVVGEIGGQGVRIASKSLWDDKNDNWTSYTFANVSQCHCSHNSSYSTVCSAQEWFLESTTNNAIVRTIQYI